MRSHEYEFTGREIARILSAPLIVLGLITLGVQLGTATGALPAPCPALDTDRTILLHQADASLKPHSADLILIGDSSCLMDVSALQLGDALRATVLNLGTLSYLDLSAYATILKQYLQTNAKAPRRVVLLMHPEALRRALPSDYHVEVLSRFYSRKDHCPPALPRFLCLLGVETLRGRVLSRAMPQPLGGSFGRDYGFTHDLWDYLSAHRGSALDPGSFVAATATGNAEYRLASSLERASHTFRQALPDGIELTVGITPVPEGFAPKSYPHTRASLLRDWNKWLQADQVLEGLPATLPDDLFASATHLNANGVVHFTAALAGQIKP